MKRMKVLFGQRRMMVLVTLAVLMLVAAALIASSASFTSTSANPANTFTAGNLKHTNSLPGAAILTVGNNPMKPGDTATGTVDITNDGDVAGVFTLSASSLVDTPGPLGANLSADLYLTVVEKDPLGAVISTPYNNVLLSGVPLPTPGINLGSFAAGEKRTYNFSVKFKDNGKPVDATSGDNRYKKAITLIEFDWEAITI
ncbi:MAG TPA: hypothetical protein VIK32_15665 [Candidatus Limnocylindrales bacterium]